MGWIQTRPGRQLRAGCRVDGRIVQRSFKTADEAEQWLRETEGCRYLPPHRRRVGRPQKNTRPHAPGAWRVGARDRCYGEACQELARTRWRETWHARNRPEGAQAREEKSLPPLEGISAAEAAERLGVKRATLFAYVSRGQLHSRRVGRASMFDPDEVDRFARGVPRDGWADPLARDQDVIM